MGLSRQSPSEATRNSIQRSDLTVNMKPVRHDETGLAQQAKHLKSIHKHESTIVGKRPSDRTNRFGVVVESAAQHTSARYPTVGTRLDQLAADVLCLQRSGRRVVAGWNQPLLADL